MIRAGRLGSTHAALGPRDGDEFGVLMDTVAAEAWPCIIMGRVRFGAVFFVTAVNAGEHCATIALQCGLHRRG